LSTISILFKVLVTTGSMPYLHTLSHAGCSNAR